MKRILLIDGTHNFLRHYIVSPQMDINGNPIGGVFGFLRSFIYFVEQFRPSEIFVCWDGPHGSLKRRTILKEYKEGRRPPSLNRTYELSDDEQKQNKDQQFLKLKEQYLSILPVHSLEYEYVEADDIIGIVHSFKKDEQKIIISSDRDFIQLLDDKTVLYNPIKREFTTNKKILQEYSIHCNNFAVARSLIGDKSDNIAGIKGFGFKTVTKLFPILAEEKEYTVADIIKYSRENLQNNEKQYSKILNNTKRIQDVYNIIQLKHSILSFDKIERIKEDMAKKPLYESVAFRILASEDLTNFDVDRFIQVFNGFFMSSTLK